MKMTRVMTFVSILVFVLPAHVAGGGLRGLMLEPLQMPPPPPAIPDLVLAQLEAPAPAPAGAPGGSPGGPSPGPAPGPAPNAMPEEPKIPKITSAICATLQGKVGALVGVAPGAPGPAPAPAAAMLQGSAPSPAAAGGDKPTVECKIYAYVSGKGAGCSCFVENPPPPFKAKVAGCPEVPNAIEELGITGPPQSLGPMSFGGQTGGWTRHTCIYRQWILDPVATGLVAAYQTKLNDARAKKYITDTYAASLNNAHNSVGGFWALTPVPWLKLYPTTPMPMAAGPAPGPAAMFSTTPPILFAPPPTTPSPFGMMTTTGRPFGAFGTPGPFGTTTGRFGMPTTPAAMGGFTTAPTYAVLR